MLTCQIFVSLPTILLQMIVVASWQLYTFPGFSLADTFLTVVAVAAFRL